MAQIEWDKSGERFYEAGVDRGVLYPTSGPGVAWNGLVSINDTPSGGETRPYYIDGFKYYNEATSSEFKAVLEAFTYPDVFSRINGSDRDLALSYEDQPRQEFGLSYRTLVGSDTLGLDRGYKIHIIYNAISEPRNSNFSTVANPADPTNFTWDITARPMAVTGFKPTAHIVWDSTKVGSHKTQELERILYGSSNTTPRLPTISELEAINRWGDALHITPNVASGLAHLAYFGSGDLKGDVSRGLYSRHADSRLVSTAKPGFYKIGS